MDITLNNIGKRYSSNQWVFKDVNIQIRHAGKFAITGDNGSGKSTLLQIVSGMILPTTGSISYMNAQKEVSIEEAIQNISFASPYVELIEEFTLTELLTFHYKFKKLVEVRNIQELINALYLTGNENKLVKNFSSGMKQRLKLGLAFYSKSEIVLLDEPTTNLDQKGLDWYLEHIQQVFNRSTLLIASNQPKEYQFCDDIWDMNDTEKSPPALNKANS